MQSDKRMLLYLWSLKMEYWVQKKACKGGERNGDHLATSVQCVFGSQLRTRASTFCAPDLYFIVSVFIFTYKLILCLYL